jgi:hypothetical protein
MKFLKLWEWIGKQPINVTKHLDAIIEVGEERFIVTGVNYENGRLISLKADKICCEMCKNNPEYNNGYAPPHTCDICGSLDAEDYEMWELRNEISK